MNWREKYMEASEALSELQETRAAEAEAVDEMRGERDQAIKDGNLVSALWESAEKEVKEMREERDAVAARLGAESTHCAIALRIVNDARDKALAERDALRDQLTSTQEAAAQWVTERDALHAELDRLKADRKAPVQGYSAGIPWAMHLRAYDAYCKRYGRQQALVEGHCRGGFHVDELDMFIPGWREELSELSSLKSEVARLTELARVRGEALEAVEWHENGGFYAYSCPWCREDKRFGHAPNCQRQRALGAP